MTQAELTLPRRSFGQTMRADVWWVSPLIVFLGLGAFVVYSTWAAFQGRRAVFGSPVIITAVLITRLSGPIHRPVPSASRAARTWASVRFRSSCRMCIATSSISRCSFSLCFRMMSGKRCGSPIRRPERLRSGSASARWSWRSTLFCSEVTLWVAIPCDILSVDFSISSRNHPLVIGLMPASAASTAGTCSGPGRVCSGWRFPMSMSGCARSASGTIGDFSSARWRPAGRVAEASRGPRAISLGQKRRSANCGPPRAD